MYMEAHISPLRHENVQAHHDDNKQTNTADQYFQEAVTRNYECLINYQSPTHPSQKLFLHTA